MVIAELKAEQESEATQRIFAHEAEGRANLEEVRHPGGLLRVNKPKQIARRYDRLSRHKMGEAVPMTKEQMPTADAEEVLAAAHSRSAEMVSEMTVSYARSHNPLASISGSIGATK